MHLPHPLRLLTTAFLALAPLSWMMADNPSHNGPPAEDTFAPSRVVSVELYPNGARVRREVTLNPTREGRGTATLRALPRSLDPSSVTARAVGSSGLELGAFQFSPSPRSLEADPRLQGLKGDRDALKQRVAEVERSRQQALQRTLFFESLAQSLRKALESHPQAESYALARQAWMDMEGIRTEVESAIASFELSLTDLRERLRLSERKLSEEQARMEAISGELSLEYFAPAPGSMTVHLEYLVGGAQWSPFYELRAEPGRSTVDLRYKVRIRQSTGEDWEDVRIELNSGLPGGAGEAPRLRPITLRVQSERWRADSVMMQMSPPPEPPPPESFERGLGLAEAGVAATTTSFFATLPERVTLQTGADPVTRDLLVRSLSAEFWSEAAPPRSREVFLTGKMTNSLEWPLLPGSSYLYVDGRLVGSGRMAHVLPGAEFTTGFGRNELVTLVRHERVRDQADSGLLEKTTRHRRKYENIVTNHMPVPHRVVLREQVPVSTNNKVQVRLLAPREAKPEEGTGFFEWERRIAPGRAESLVVEFEVMHPADWLIPAQF